MIPIGEVFGGMDGPVQAIPDASPQARHHFTRFDQVDQLVAASEADPVMGIMARLLPLRPLPFHRNPQDRFLKTQRL